jgi:probable rRNA maturation factor
MTTVDITGSVPRFPKRDIVTFARRVLRHLDVVTDDLAIAFVDDAAMRKLNKDFRRKDKTTDVLTFPGESVSSRAAKTARDPYRSGASHKATGPSPSTRLRMTPEHLGDIVISLDQARRQAADEKHSLAIEVRYLIVHGILHALGYDHETDNGEMNALELEVRAKVGLT